MDRERRLRKSAEFQAVQRKGKWWSNQLLTLRALPNQLDHSRHGFLVSGRVGKAVVRNRVKRRLREIVRREPLLPGWDLVFIARTQIVEAPFGDIQGAVRDLLRRGRLVERKTDGGEGKGDRQ